MNWKMMFRKVANLISSWIHFQRYGHKKLNDENSLNIGTERFIGMWQGRDGLKDSSVWVRRVRENEWSKQHGIDHY
jgi:hypothetical protein